MHNFTWLSARSVAEAAAAASMTLADAMVLGDSEGGNGAILKAGGIDVLDVLKEGLLVPATLVSLTGVDGLGDIAEEAGTGIRIGAMVTLAKLADHPLVRRRYAALAGAAAQSASPQIRNVATLGGNLLQRPRCWYFRSLEYHCLRKGGDHCFALGGDNRYHAIFNNRPCAIVHPSSAATVLVALGAVLELVHPDSGTRRVPLEQFFLAPDVMHENDLRPQEILTHVHLPALAARVRTAYERVGERQAFDWPLVDVAAALELGADGRCRRAAIVLGGAAPAPHRAHLAEQALANRVIDESAAAAAGRAAIEAATPLAGNAYKLPLLETLVRRAVLAAAGKPQAA
jgi:xanthine dehydrogenase YagS FAD-binding subunit